MFRNMQRFSFDYNGRPMRDSAECTVREQEWGQEAEYRLPGGLLVTNRLRLYPDFGGAEWVTFFENTGKEQSGRISNLADALVRIPFPHQDVLQYTAVMHEPEEDARVYAPYGSDWTDREFGCPEVDEVCSNQYFHHIYPGHIQAYENRGGRSAQGQAPFFDVSYRNKGVIFAIGWSGQWRCTLDKTEDDLGIQAGVADADFVLYPGEKIRTASFVILPYEGDFAQGHNRWRRFVRTHFSPDLSAFGGHGPLCLGLWGGLSTDRARERVALMARERFPADCVWMDAGWYGGDAVGENLDEYEGNWARYTGDWRPNAAHPDKLRELAADIRAMDKGFLLWFEPERVLSGTPVATEHPEYLLECSKEKQCWTPAADLSTYLLDLGNEAAWQWCYRTLHDRIADLHLQVYRQDFNMDPLPYFRENEPADRKGMRQIHHIMGLYRLWDALLADFPGLVIDNCASGGRRIDIELARRSIPLWRSDSSCPANARTYTNQMHNVQYGNWVTYHGTGCGRTFGDLYRFRSAYAPAMTCNFFFSGREKEGTPEDWAWLRQAMAEYRRVRPYLTEDMYPLTAQTPVPDTMWAVQYHRPGRGDGVVQVCKREHCPYVTVAFPLRGVDETARYRFVDADDCFGGSDGSDDAFTVSGKALMEEGLTLTIPGKRVAKVYFYEKV